MCVYAYIYWIMWNISAQQRGMKMHCDTSPSTGWDRASTNTPAAPVLTGNSHWEKIHAPIFAAQLQASIHFAVNWVLIFQEKSSLVMV